MKRWITAGFVLLALNSIYLAATSAPTVFYMANVLLHVLLGAAVAVGFLVLIRRLKRSPLSPASTLLLLASALFGLLLVVLGNVHANQWALWAHVSLAVAGVIWLVAETGRGRLTKAAVALGILLPVAMGLWNAAGDPNALVRNPDLTPVSMEEEGGGPESPFWPSSAKTVGAEYIPSEYFTESEKCAECHRDIYDQWNSSAHHFASFNNQFYRKSIEHMQEVAGSTQSSKWCAGCHDHAVLFAGKWEEPIAGQIDTPAAQAGLACVSCHSIVHVDSTMGNGGFTIEYPELHELAASENPIIHRLSSFLTYLEPEPHRKTFLKPFMKSSEFCSACHKVHLDKPVNNYRWLRGFNSYDNWQASGVSGEGARSFYYPEQPRQCADCHMPLVPGKDPAARNGMVHSHQFPGANTALAHVNRDERQASVTESFLQSGFITVDLFAATPAEDEGLQMVRRSGEGQAAMSTFAVGEEAAQTTQITIREVGEVTAPLDASSAVFRPGDVVRVDAVVRTRVIGHFFPSGTVDAFDVWLEMEGVDAGGRVIFRSGALENDGDGAVDKGAHFYRSFMLDGAGNLVDKRNAWQARSVLYARLIPPGAADVVHYRIRIPEDARGPVTLRAKLNHRKFTHYYTGWAYSGRPDPGQKANLDYESRDWTLGKEGIPANVSGQIKDEIPVLPITVLAQAEATLQVNADAGETVWTPLVRREDWGRWNDWGIGMLLQGDLKGAEYAFRKATEADAGNPDGWLNVARALIQEGEVEAAKPFLAKAMELGPKLGRVHFFQAMAQKAEGDYAAALQSLERVNRMYPRDRVVLNEIGLIRFRLRDYAGAVQALKQVLAVDPEDLQAHYTLMLAYRGLGDREASAREQELFRRFKADESAQVLTARQRQQSPEDNNERQAIHDHVSAVPE